MNEKLDLLIRILGWSLAVVGMILMFLMAIGVLHSPEEILVTGLVNAGVLVMLGRMDEKLKVFEGKLGDFNIVKDRFNKLESRFELLWTDFKKRKKV